MSEGWSKDEQRAAVDAYIDMLRKDRAGQPFTKKRYYEEIATQFGRTAKAFEYRMQNISYVLSLVGRAAVRMASSLSPSLFHASRFSSA